MARWAVVYLTNFLISSGGPLFDEESEQTSLLLYNAKERHGFVKESSVSLGAEHSNFVLQEYDYDAKAFTNPPTNFCLAVFSSFFCVVVGIFAINHAVQAHHYKEVIIIIPGCGGCGPQRTLSGLRADSKTCARLR